jgi:tRNA pseudouridine38-40 synthase
MPRYKLTIEYRGDCFKGWQRQHNLSSVQGSIEKAIFNMFHQEVLVMGAGRTDAGVHALGQVAHIDLNNEIPPFRLCEGLNHYLRDSGAVVLDAELVPEDFHARFSAKARTYEYRIVNRRAPLAVEENFAWHVKHPLDIKKMQDAAKFLIGNHDFTSFRCSDCQALSPIRTLERFDINHLKTPTGTLIYAEVTSRSFLHNQVRIMIGTLKLVGEGKLCVSDIPLLIEARDRRLTGPTAPPSGLYLKSVLY